MPPGVAFVLYLAIGSLVIFMFLLLCVRISVFIEDTCPIRFCLRRKQRKMRKVLIRRVLYPDEPESPRPAPPSDENITADIICQPYIYRDAYSTGLTGITMLANLPLTFANTSGGNPCDALVTSNPSRNPFTSRAPPPPDGTSSANQTPPPTHSEINIELHDDETESLPPEYLNVVSQDLERQEETASKSGDANDPPPSYYECVNVNNSTGTN